MICRPSTGMRPSEGRNAAKGAARRPVFASKASHACRWSGLTYNDQPAVDVSSEKHPGVFLRLVEVRENK